MTDQVLERIVSYFYVLAYSISFCCRLQFLPSSISSLTESQMDTQQPKDAAAVSSEIARYYAGKSIFMTGATGFLGKALVEKLLRECSGLRSIYLLVRKKKEKSASERVDELFNCKVSSFLS